MANVFVVVLQRIGPVERQVCRTDGSPANANANANAKLAVVLEHPKHHRTREEAMRDSAPII
jgi:hypothetical protein